MNILKNMSNQNKFIYIIFASKSSYNHKRIISAAGFCWDREKKFWWSYNPKQIKFDGIKVLKRDLN